jgi:CRISPR-associated exonuclease Cas4
MNRAGERDISDEIVPISALEHYSYCPRQAALILVDGVWYDNAATARGSVAHRRADEAGQRRHRGVLVMRAVPLWSERLGLSGRADVVELSPDLAIRPVEYKSGVHHSNTAEVQVCAQAMCLEEMLGCSIDTAEISYSGHRKRKSVALVDELRAHTMKVVSAVRSLRREQQLPGAPNDERCTTCQLLHHCQPEITGDLERIHRYLSDEVFSCRS